MKDRTSVLLVEPDHATAEAIALILEIKGFDVTLATRGAQAQMLFAGMTDLKVLMAQCDVMVEDGAVTLLTWAALLNPGLALVGICEPEGRPKHEVERCQFLAKPFDRDAVLRAVADARKLDQVPEGI